ncbi:metal dependent phosphohydrolase [Enterovirga rhinocerotis]|uniref:Metal dependent phosphohydrolase n=2 Tax=Enterovirga rhinocerotis TaxID=1339210 RepID=A0A4R7CC10_9HYPH|nr:HD family hydrolase [Enterovirga rhinocerotis]TDR94317.1 metal dependent phosphohydrolase [Enterovirga rhinocerotis]
MLSGRRLDILDPSPLDVELDDIAHGIARVPRWNGQTVGAYPYSVAQHSCLVEAIAAELDPGLTDAARLAVLLHDAPEYVVGDVITPLKAALGGAFGEIEHRLHAVIHIAFGLPPEASPELRRLIKRADRSAAWLEATSLAGFSLEEAVQTFGRPDTPPDNVGHLLEPWPTEDAQARFRARVLVCLPAKQVGHPRTL